MGRWRSTACGQYRGKCAWESRTAAGGAIKLLVLPGASRVLTRKVTDELQATVRSEGEDGFAVVHVDEDLPDFFSSDR